MQGVPHKNDNTQHAGVLWDVVRAIASTKMHYYPRLREQMLGQRPVGQTWKFPDAFPDLSPASGGMEPLNEDTWQTLKEQFNLETHADYLKHIPTKHDGEAKFVGDDNLWEPFPGSAGDVHKACFWNYQFATTYETRK